MSATILLTGATGYIGGRLLRRLEEDGCTVRCLARHPERVAAAKATTTIVRGDCLDESSLDPAFAGVQVAYYLVHSMVAGPDFAALDRRAAENFGRAAGRAGVRRIIYLGGLANDMGAASAHLKSRVETGEALRLGGVPVIEFRASIVIGAGSVSFEMIRALVERLPVMICPRWVSTPAQPIAVDDVLAYLVAALNLPDGPDRVFEIGGPTVVSYGDMMREYARLRGLHRLLVPVPVLTPRLSGLWLALVTPSQARIGRALVEGLKTPTVVRSLAARRAFRIHPMPLRTAIARAIDEGAPTCFKRDTRSVIVNASPGDAFAPIRRIGGAAGWYFGNVLWRVRGWVDRSLGGVGMTRGRRDPESVRIGDVIDGWTVTEYESDRRLRLAADLKMPGRGWLDFEVTPVEGGARSTIRLTATFDPRGLLGRAYWLASMPLQAFIFRGLLRNIASRALARRAAPNASVFCYRSIVPVRAMDLFGWHERPDALLDLMPPGRWVRLEERVGGLRDGGWITLSIGIGPLRMRWKARHFGYIRGQQFCDEQVRGPFSTWRHTHRIEPIGADRSLYEDCVEYALPGGRLVNFVAAPLLRALLRRTFAHRHDVVRASVRQCLAAGVL